MLSWVVTQIREQVIGLEGIPGNVSKEMEK